MNYRRWKLLLVVAAMLLGSISVQATSRRVACAGPVALFGFFPELFRANYISPQEAANRAYLLAQRMLPAGVSRENLKGTNRPVSRNSWSRGQWHSKKRVAQRLIQIGDFFTGEAATESSLELSPDEPHYWELVNGFGLEITGEAEVGIFLNRLMRTNAWLQSIENAARFSTSPNRMIKFIRRAGLTTIPWLLLMLGMDASAGKLEEHSPMFALTALLSAGINDHWIRDYFQNDSAFDLRTLELITTLRPRKDWWNFHGTNADLPLGRLAKGELTGAGAAEEGQGDDEEDDVESGEGWKRGGISPQFVALPSFVDGEIETRLFNYTSVESAPFGIRTGIKSVEKIRKRLRGRNAVSRFPNASDRVQFDMFVENSSEGETPHKILLWFRRVPK